MPRPSTEFRTNFSAHYNSSQRIHTYRIQYVDDSLIFGEDDRWQIQDGTSVNLRAGRLPSSAFFAVRSLLPGSLLFGSLF
jgi:hypothetical protein